MYFHIELSRTDDPQPQYNYVQPPGGEHIGTLHVKYPRRELKRLLKDANCREGQSTRVEVRIASSVDVEMKSPPSEWRKVVFYLTADQCHEALAGQTVNIPFDPPQPDMDEEAMRRWAQTMEHALHVKELEKEETREALKQADVIMGIDPVLKKTAVFFGRDRMERIAKTLDGQEHQPANAILFSLAFATDELEYLVAITKHLKGSCCYGENAPS